MLQLTLSILSQVLIFLPLALGLYISFCIIKATDLTLDSSFVLGAGVFARLIELGISPIIATFAALCAGVLAGTVVATIQRGQKISSLLAGVLATFIFTSGNLIIMGKPNISLLEKITLLNNHLINTSNAALIITLIYCFLFLGIAVIILVSKLGLTLRAFGDNPNLLHNLGKSIEGHRLFGFAFTNCLAAAAGCITAQTVGYADIGMGFGVTLTALGAIILGKQLCSLLQKTPRFNITIEFLSCFLGVIFYFTAVNTLLYFHVDTLFLKLFLGIILVAFLRSATSKQNFGRNITC